MAVVLGLWVVGAVGGGETEGDKVGFRVVGLAVGVSIVGVPVTVMVGDREKAVTRLLMHFSALQVPHGSVLQGVPSG